MRQFICEDCSKSPNCPMLKNELWETISTKQTLLCVKCAETRLKRQIALGDLLPCLGNDWGLVIAKRAYPQLDITDYEAHHRVERALS